MTLVIICYRYIGAQNKKSDLILDNIMNAIATATSLAEKASEIYGDYQRGKKARMGMYAGPESTSKMGHYNRPCKCMGKYN